MKYIKKFQQDNNLTPDGIIGANTISKMKETFGIDNKIKLAHFLGQLDHETAGFKYGKENLNYSKEALLKVFRFDFDWNKDKTFNPIEIKKAEELERKPEQIANFVYANQNGNGDENSGDGWKYRGRGAIQLTGKKNYELFASYMDDENIINNPDIVESKYYFESAIFFFKKNRLFDFLKEVDSHTIRKLTRRINGGYNGIEDRILKTQKYFNILNNI